MEDHSVLFCFLINSNYFAIFLRFLCFSEKKFLRELKSVPGERSNFPPERFRHALSIPPPVCTMSRISSSSPVFPSR